MKHGYREASESEKLIHHTQLGLIKARKAWCCGHLICQGLK